MALHRDILALPGLNVKRCGWVKASRNDAKRRRGQVALPMWTIFAMAHVESSEHGFLAVGVALLTGCVKPTAHCSREAAVQLACLRNDLPTARLLLEGGHVEWVLERCAPFVGKPALLPVPMVNKKMHVPHAAHLVQHSSRPF